MASIPTIYCSYTKLVPLKDLTPHPRNPNQHFPKQVELLAGLMLRHGIRQSICVSNRSGYIIRGHGRFAAAKKLRLKEFPVDFQDYRDEAEEIADMVADNKIQEYSKLDLEAVNDLLFGSDLGDSAFVAEDFGFDSLEFDMVFGEKIKTASRTFSDKPRESKREKSDLKKGDEGAGGRVCPCCGRPY